MTNPCGASFLCYKRERASEAKLLIEMQHEHGIPTWQDVENLEEEPFRDRIHEVLNDPNIANGILWITPEVGDSRFINQVELPEILGRARRGDGFFVVPVLAGGVTPGNVSTVLDERRIVDDLRHWNCRTVEASPVGVAEVTPIVQRVLARRIERVHAELPSEEPLRVRFDTFNPSPRTSSYALVINWSHLLSGRIAEATAWEMRLLPALQALARAVAMHANGRVMRLEGQAGLPALLAFGRAFPAPGGVRVTWNQQTAGKPAFPVSLDTAAVNTSFKSDLRSHGGESSDVVIAISVTSDVNATLGARHADLPPCQAELRIAPTEGGSFTIQEAGQVRHIVSLLEDGLVQARTRYGNLGTLHLYSAIPTGMALLIGQVLNTYGAVQTYEFDRDRQSYVPSVRLPPPV